jgi:hypothetical protein
MTDFFTVKETQEGLTAICGSGKISKNLEKLLLSAYRHLSSIETWEAEVKEWKTALNILVLNPPEEIKVLQEQLKLAESYIGSHKMVVYKAILKAAEEAEK